MPNGMLVRALRTQKEMFDRSTAVLEEADSAFTPSEGTFSVAQQVAHVAQTLEWFVEGAFDREDGPDPDFARHLAEVGRVTSLHAARVWMDRAWENAERRLAGASEADLDRPYGGEIFGGAPRRMLVDMNGDHVAHHRGALTVYARLLGRTAPMPYA
jgi:uncharacterized damage-inducible protein DinB